LQEKGIGIATFGQVIDKKQLLQIVAGTYAILSFLLPYVLSVIDPELPDLAGAAGGAGSLCPYGWVEADGSCFKLFGGDHAEDRKTWPQAEAHCQALTGHLASVTTQTQQDTILSISSGLTTWIGLNDRALEGSFVWSDGEPFVSIPGIEKRELDDEPNADWGRCESGGDCVRLKGGQRSAYDDVPCESCWFSYEGLDDRFTPLDTCSEFRLPYICSMPNSPSKSTRL
jgi:hypothetical protein